MTKSIYDFNHDSYATDGYHHKCKKCAIEQKQQWRVSNREHYNEHNRNYYVVNTQARNSRNMHNRLWSILKRGSYSCRTEEIIGLNKPTYIEWLSYNFEGEMTWVNYGSIWEIDLIIPASAYDLTNEQQLLACFNWKNIRPCLKSDNLAKANFLMPFAQANQSIRILAFIRKLRQLKLEAFLNKFE